MTNPIERVLVAIGGGKNWKHAVTRMGIGGVVILILGFFGAIAVDLLLNFPREILIVTGVIIGWLVVGGLSTRLFWEYIVPMCKSTFG